MKCVWILTVVGLLLVGVTGCSHTEATVVAEEARPEPAPVKTVMLIDREDPDMQEAIRTARRDVDTFLIALHQSEPGCSDFAVKVAFTEQDVIEHLWLIEPRYEEGVLVGKLASTPQYLTDYLVGGTYAVTPEEVTDWYYYQGDQMVGGYTVKLLEQLAKNNHGDPSVPSILESQASEPNNELAVSSEEGSIAAQENALTTPPSTSTDLLAPAASEGDSLTSADSAGNNGASGSSGASENRATNDLPTDDLLLGQ